MDKKILILDYDVGNIDSILSAVKDVGYQAILSNKKEDLNLANKIILPGQGSFKYGINQIRKHNLEEILKKKVLIEKIPILGICLGMQLFATYGYEEGKESGLDFISGEVKSLDSFKQKLPHIGWNEVNIINKNYIFNNIENNSDFYFVHGFHFICNNQKNVLAKTTYEEEFVSVIKKDNIIGVQFHPEKSLKKGLLLIKNFLSTDEKS